MPTSQLINPELSDLFIWIDAEDEQSFDIDLGDYFILVRKRIGDLQFIHDLLLEVLCLESTRRQTHKIRPSSRGLDKAIDFLWRASFALVVMPLPDRDGRVSCPCER